MLFNSYEFIFCFLPVTFIVYFYLNSKGLSLASKYFMAISSIFFYGWWDISYLPVICSSIVFNYSLGLRLRHFRNRNILIFGVVINVAFLGFFKYTDMIVQAYNTMNDTQLLPLNLALPLAISYFTFQQIAFLVDAYREDFQKHDFLDYIIFISFFPQLLMGPITSYRKIIPQFKSKTTFILNWTNVSLGVYIFSIGLAKKTMLGDPLTAYAEVAFNNAQQLTMIEAWYSALSYVLSYYFDLSGYADMAVGIGRIFNIDIPKNFYSPYKSKNIIEYWKRWHITVSFFLKNYVYKVLRNKDSNTNIRYVNILITFIISGLWHGSTFNFLVWGAINGIFVIICHKFKETKLKMNFYASWALMFLSIIVTRILFVSKSFKDASYVTLTLFDISKLRFNQLFYIDTEIQSLYILVGFILVFGFKNTSELAIEFKTNFKTMALTITFLTVSILTISNTRVFLYFQF